MSKERSIKNILRTFNKEQIELADNVVLSAIRKKHEPIDYKIFESLSGDQKTVLYYIVGKTVQDTLFEDKYLPSNIVERCNNDL